MRYWLFKSEADSYSIDDLERDGTTHWDGVRNYQARNMLRDDIAVGDVVLFHHSNGDPPAIVGSAMVTRAGYADHTQFDAGSPKFDPKATPDNPRWFMVDITFRTRFSAPLTLDMLRGEAALANMELLRRGSRLSVQPVREEEYRAIEKMSSSTHH